MTKDKGARVSLAPSGTREGEGRRREGRLEEPSIQLVSFAPLLGSSNLRRPRLEIGHLREWLKEGLSFIKPICWGIQTSQIVLNFRPILMLRIV
jgi:hypothetical protein